MADNCWDKLKEILVERDKQVRQYKILNTQTGTYICETSGAIKIFKSKLEANGFIETNRLSSVYEIEEN